VREGLIYRVGVERLVLMGRADWTLFLKFCAYNPGVTYVFKEGV